MATRANRILLVLPSLERGGAELVMLRLAEEFLVDGRELHLVTLVGGGALQDRVPKKLVLHSLIERDGWRSQGLALALLALPRLAKLLREIRPGAVLSSMTGTNLLTVIARQLSGCQTRLVLREESSAINLRSRLKRIALPMLYARADAIVAVSGGVANDMRSLGVSGERVHVINNPVDVQRLRRLALVGPGLPDNDRRPYVMSLGRLTQAKDYPSLLRAYATSTLRMSHRLVIVGEGEQRVGLHDLVRGLGLEDHVLFTGAMDNPYGVLAHSALLVLSSRWEGFGNVLLEAMALGVPVVATDCPHGPRELLDGGRYGRLARVGDSESLARAMEEELAKRSAEASDVLINYDPKRVATRHLALLDGHPRS